MRRKIQFYNHFTDIFTAAVENCTSKKFCITKKIFYSPYVVEGKSQLAQNVYEEGKTILKLGRLSASAFCSAGPESIRIIWRKSVTQSIDLPNSGRQDTQLMKIFARSNSVMYRNK
jgi:hypothetical protein